MKIKLRNYILEQEQSYPALWNVKKVMIIQDPESPNFGKENEISLIYAVTLPAAVHYVIHERVFEIEETVELKEFVKVYEKAVNKLIQKLENNGSTTEA